MAFGIYNYRKTGSGIKKGAPKKKAFFLFWEIFGAKFWKIIGLNLIFLLFSIPIVTIGPATAAMTHVMRKFILGDPIFMFHEYVNAFKKNFKQSFIMGLIDLPVATILLYNINAYAGMVTEESDMGTKLILAGSIAMGFVLIMMHFYIYPQIVALNLNLVQILKNSFILMIAGFKRSFVSFFLWFVIISLLYLGLPFTVFLLPFIPCSWLCFISTFCVYPVIQKYIINPYYESRGEKNPENEFLETSEEAVFEDMGGSEAPTEIPKEKSRKERSTGSVKVRTKGKVIR